jgi:malate synthase
MRFPNEELTGKNGGQPMTNRFPDGVELKGQLSPAFSEILTPEALSLIATLHRKFDTRRRELLQRRVERQEAIHSGAPLDFLPETEHIRSNPDWKVAATPPDLQKRHVEITGPTERKMLINALNSGADVFMADFEDANSPTWTNMVEGQLNLRDAVRGVISFTSPEGKRYELNEKTSLLLVRPRGWHLVEKNLLVDGEPVSGSLFDFGLYMFHNARPAGKRLRAVFLSTEDGKPPGSPPVE